MIQYSNVLRHPKCMMYVHCMTLNFHITVHKLNWWNWKGKPSGSTACMGKQQPRFYWSCKTCFCCAFQATAFQVPQFGVSMWNPNGAYGLQLLSLVPVEPYQECRQDEVTGRVRSSRHKRRQRMKALRTAHTSCRNVVGRDLQYVWMLHFTLYLLWFYWYIYQTTFWETNN